MNFYYEILPLKNHLTFSIEYFPMFRSPLLPSEYRSNSVSGLRPNKSMPSQPNPPAAHKNLPSNSSQEGRNSSSEGRERKTNSDSESEREDLEITIPDPALRLADDLTINGNENGWKLGN